MGDCTPIWFDLRRFLIQWRLSGCWWLFWFLFLTHFQDHFGVDVIIPVSFRAFVPQYFFLLIIKKSRHRRQLDLYWRRWCSLWWWQNIWPRYEKPKIGMFIVAIADHRCWINTENNTYGIDLSKDWTNSSLKMIQTDRPFDPAALNSEALWYDNKSSTIYCFGGDKSFATNILRSIEPPPDSIWRFRPNGKGGGAWYQVLGPISRPFPNDIHRISNGKSASDGNSAYYLGGFRSSETSLGLPNPRFPSRGLLVFDFDTLIMTNSSDDGYYVWKSGGHDKHPHLWW